MSTIKSGNTTLISGRQKMSIPQGGAHVRAVEIRLNQLFRERPVVVANVHSNSPGNTFTIWSIEYNNLGSQSQVVIHATNTETGKLLDYEFWCEYIITGETI